MVRLGTERAALVMLVASLALGPGLLVNVALKDHWHRPRPVQVIEFGGADPFRPYDRLDGSCVRNCSFVSGEGASAFWTVAPALLLPPPWHAVALGGALCFAAAAGGLRMAFGGHFLSDTVFAALFTWLVVAGLLARDPRGFGPPAERRYHDAGPPGAEAVNGKLTMLTECGVRQTFPSEIREGSCRPTTPFPVIRTRKTTVLRVIAASDRISTTSFG